MKFKIISALLLLIAGFFIISCENEQSIEFKRYYSEGAIVYQEHCQNCHAADGDGLSALIPPINDSLYLKNHKASLACFINSGLKGPIIVNKRNFEGTMPPNNLSPMEVAQVLTYINNSFGNKLGLTTVDQAEAA
ncbi:MAG: c-type cytochrome, partial [Mucilaginibacter sp.]